MVGEGSCAPGSDWGLQWRGEDEPRGDGEMTVKATEARTAGGGEVPEKAKQAGARAGGEVTGNVMGAAKPYGLGVGLEEVDSRT